ncbi:hypothetical protein NCLIV_063670 [Neospora caninum Liverpool]|uniref:Tetratricopeptide repeat-containing protein n=1 Tax=Neospora caninum (strain Liverpool) TaxID=572307 RepID=F0VQE4_NEOCL|nr:hypothetical protein NCLIV_063670 [Neospora caninum Liverpool]CBZ55941.1 hypothetical protein NCLIV_063670 [Neospora caninum Liverpool]CEL70686.1 TPA: tetratricopeptide repeat-containing protein [Neospora caninum Liverpool]|eukprot:XP_003885967.1 hypothetical protein NCLIV_063670 [Neospora caninum Liverpool]
MVLLILAFSLALAVLVGWVLQRQLHSIFATAISTFLLHPDGEKKCSASTQMVESGGCTAAAEATGKKGDVPCVTTKPSKEGNNDTEKNTLMTSPADEEERGTSVAGGVRMVTSISSREENLRGGGGDEEKTGDKVQSKNYTGVEREERNVVAASDCSDTRGTSAFSSSSQQAFSGGNQQQEETQGHSAHSVGSQTGEAKRDRRHHSDVFPSPPSSPRPSSPPEAPVITLLADKEIASLTPAEESFLLEQDRRMRGCFKYDRPESVPPSASSPFPVASSPAPQSPSLPSSVSPSSSLEAAEWSSGLDPPADGAVDSFTEAAHGATARDKGKGEEEAEGRRVSSLDDSVEARSPSQRSTSAAPSPSNAGVPTGSDEFKSTAIVGGASDAGAEFKAGVFGENVKSSLCQSAQEAGEQRREVDAISYDGEKDEAFSVKKSEGAAEAGGVYTPEHEDRKKSDANEDKATAPLSGEEEKENIMNAASVQAVGAVLEVEDDSVKPEGSGFPGEGVGGEEGDDEREDDDEEHCPKVEDLGEVFPDEEKKGPPRVEEVEDEKKDEEDLEDKSAAELKELGNRKFREGKYEAAIDIYTQALDRLDEEEDDWLDEFDAIMQDKEDELEAAENARYEGSSVGVARRNREQEAEERETFKDAREEEDEAHEPNKATNSDEAKGTEEARAQTGGVQEDPETEGSVHNGNEQRDEEEEKREKEEERREKEKEHLLTEEEFLAFKEEKEREREAKALEFNQLRAVLLSNRAACHLHGKCWEAVIADCTEAIQCNPSYAKAYLRRFTANEALTKWHDAVADINKAIELDPSLEARYRADQQRVKKKSEAQFEKEKEEMIGKLKDFGNFVLGKVGLSLDNFKVEQNPDTGAYNISFQQNAQPPVGTAASQ